MTDNDRSGYSLMCVQINGGYLWAIPVLFFREFFPTIRSQRFPVFALGIFVLSLQPFVVNLSIITNSNHAFQVMI